jgi:hypothetical protein
MSQCCTQFGDQHEQISTYAKETQSLTDWTNPTNKNKEECSSLVFLEALES